MIVIVVIVFNLFFHEKIEGNELINITGNYPGHKTADFNL
jgi:hypothetical protein